MMEERSDKAKRIADMEASPPNSDPGQFAEHPDFVKVAGSVAEPTTPIKPNQADLDRRLGGPEPAVWGSAWSACSSTSTIR